MKNSAKTPPSIQPESLSGSPTKDWWLLVFAAAFGAVLGTSLVKFGNPVILDNLVTEDVLSRIIPSLPGGAAGQPAPASADWQEVLFRPWAMGWGLAMLAVVGLLAWSAGPSFPRGPYRFLAVPGIWFGWQLLSGAQSVDPALTRLTLLHFSGCMACLFLGWYALSAVRRPFFFWSGLLIGFGLVLWQGLGQHYGGLEAVRNFFYERPDWQQSPPEVIKRFTSGRIFATLVYPNALAGVILLLAPCLTLALWRMSERLPRLVRAVASGLLAYTCLACLVWSGSKSGWLIALIMGIVALLHAPVTRRAKLIFVISILFLGLAGFFVRYAGYFKRGATSVSARFDYWNAAWKTAVEHPLLGTGPGTFSIAYKRIKKPESEMTRLAHNDYLEQASDSGWVGLCAYVTFVIGALSLLYRNSHIKEDSLLFSVWIGLLGWATQGFIEFGLYIPALAWVAFALFGWLLGAAARAGPLQVGRFKSTELDPRMRMQP